MQVSAAAAVLLHSACLHCSLSRPGSLADVFAACCPCCLLVLLVGSSGLGGCSGWGCCLGFLKRRSLEVVAGFSFFLFGV